MVGENGKDKKGFSGLSDLTSDISGRDRSIKSEPKEIPPSSTSKKSENQENLHEDRLPDMPAADAPPLKPAWNETVLKEIREKYPSANDFQLMACFGIKNNSGEYIYKGETYKTLKEALVDAYSNQKTKDTQKQPLKSEPRKTKPPSRVEPIKSEKNKGGIKKKWIFGIIGVIFVIWLINNGGQPNNNYSYNPPTSSESYSNIQVNQTQKTQSQEKPKNLNQNDVKIAQQLLIDLGYDPGMLDGLYGPRTAQAVKAFQHNNGFVQDGLIDKNLLDMLRTTQTWKDSLNTKKKTEVSDTYPGDSVTADIPVKDYLIPPSSPTSTNAPWISDEAMEKCVKMYNEIRWLEDEIEETSVDQYSQASVDSYNAKISHHSELIDFFNENCAGKQSESAYKATMRLNQQQSQ